MDNGSDPTNPILGDKQGVPRNTEPFVPKSAVSSTGLYKNHPSSPGQQVLTRQIQTRRLWIFRTVVILSISAVFLCFLVMWRRDQLTVTLQVQSLEKPAAILQTRIDELGRLPAFVREFSECNLAFYVSDIERDYAIQASGPVIIAATPPIELLLSENGRAVVIYQQGKVKPTWMTVSQYDKDRQEQVVAIQAFEQKRKLQPPVLP